MERMTRFRPRMLLVLFALLLGFFAFTLYRKQVFETKGVIDNSTTYTTWTYVKAARGDILDRNGNVLVGNRASYDLVINHYVLASSEGPNQAIYNLMMLCQEQGIAYNDNFPITKERPFTYTLDQYNSAWQGYFQKFLQNRGDLDSDISAPLLIEQLRESYGIPEEWSDEEARLVLGIRYEMTLRNCTNLPNYVFIDDVDDTARSAILELNIPGLNVEASTVREYHTEYAAHILGYVGAMTAKQWEYYKELGYSMDAEVGQSGFELAFEEYLHGTDGIRVDTVTPDGTIIESKYKQEPVAGNHVEVTIDIDLQQAAEEQLAQRIYELQNQEITDASKNSGQDVEGAAVIAMDTRTGQILACASYPTYKLATFREDFEALSEDPLKPMYNRALQATYPPGSTFKPCMVIAGINNNVINRLDEITDLGVYDKYWDSAGFKVSCLAYTSSGGTHGPINSMEALCVSCNYFFYALADMEYFKWEYMDETAKALGLGEATGIELPEKLGQRANPQTKLAIYDEDNQAWTAADRLTAAIGQSDHRFTPLQLCVYASTLANKGTRYSATFLNRVVSTDYRSLVLENKPEIASVLEISEDAYIGYSQGMKYVATWASKTLLGTALKVFDDYPIEVAAKTGTAQTGINNESDNGAFICYAPADEPEIAIAVYGENSGSGSAMGYVARGILDSYFEVGESGQVDTYENQMS